MSLLEILGLKQKKKKDFSTQGHSNEKPDKIYYDMAGKRRRAHSTWYRGDATNFHPVRDSLSEPDAFEKFVGYGWLPTAPFINRAMYIAAFGSCFAAEVTRFLIKSGYSVFGGELNLNAHVIRSGEGIVNSAALLQQFEWAFESRTPHSPVWHDKDGTPVVATDDVRETTRQIFEKTEVFILTLGLSEVWCDKETGDVFWRAVPKESFDPSRHGFRVLGADENRANLRRTYELIRANRPSAEIILTLSPVPLAATFRPVSCITANAVSKASLRIAIDEIMREYSDDPKLHYFPSYEIITDFLPNSMGDDLRHPTPESVKFIMNAFKRHFLI